MPRSEDVILTNMCLVEDKDDNCVVQIRDPKRYDWSGAVFPGGDCVIIMTGAENAD